MARKRKRSLQVYLNGRLVGTLRREASGAIDFRYDAAWLDWQHALPVSLSLPLREDRYIGDPVIAVFDNLLPDSAEIRVRLAERLGADGSDAYSLLDKLGRDCVGALQFLPEGDVPGPVGHIAGHPASDAYIAAKLADLTAMPLGVDADEAFRISLAGAQEKTALLFWKSRWHVPEGSTPTTHILKPPIGLLPNGIDFSLSVENEYLCMKIMAAFGLPTAEVDMAEFGGRRVLVVERFDRRWTADGRLLRLPQEDCCQALSVPPTLKYEADGGPGMSHIFDLLKGSDDPEIDRAAFLKTQILFWLLGATDGHGKNFSVFLMPGGRFRLAPLYDVMSTQPARDAGQLAKNRMKLALAVGDNQHYRVDEIAPRHFGQTAVINGLSVEAVRDIFEELAGLEQAAMDHVLNDLPAGFPDALVSSIGGGFHQRLRSWERHEQ